MLNAEKFKKEILAMMDKNDRFAIDNKNVLRKCVDLKCSECLFGEGLCYFERMKWLLSEYKEPVKVSGLEHELLKFWYESGCCYRYIARDSSGNLFLYVRRPTKKAEVWASIEQHKFISDFNDLFKFIQWEDSEPTSIKEVLENCEVVEDAEE